MSKPPEGKRFYGSITVSDRGQIVIPAEARRDFNIQVGDKLLVLGDLEQGLALIKAATLLQNQPGLLGILGEEVKPSSAEKSESTGREEKGAVE